MNEIIKNVSFEMQRYSLEEYSDGTFRILDDYRDVVVRDNLTQADEPMDIVDEMNARGAVAAMREPTEGMKTVAEAWNFPAETIWKAMIDKVLEE